MMINRCAVQRSAELQQVTNLWKREWNRTMDEKNVCTPFTSE